MENQKTYTTGFVTSKDGTKIGYRQFGQGPGLVIVHGGMQAAQNFMGLATALSDAFTVYVPDRRGRGLSGPFGENYSSKKEIEDLDALLTKTGTHQVFGLSSGALITLISALQLTKIRKIALFEPPISVSQSVLSKFMPRYEREIADGKIVSALITVMKGLQLSPLLKIVPRFLLVPLFKLALRSESTESKENVPLKELIPTFHYDNILVTGTEGKMDTFKNVQAKALLLSGSKSPGYLRMVVKKLAAIIPRARAIEFAGLDHSGPDDGGKPALVAEELRSFFHEHD